METIALIKPDAVRRNLTGDIISHATVFGDLMIARMRLLTPDLDIARPGSWNPRKFYARQHEGNPYFEELIEFMSSGPSVAMLLEVKEGDAIKAWRDCMGPFRQGERIRGTVRGNFMLRVSRPMENLVHGSDSAESFLWEFSCSEDVL